VVVGHETRTNQADAQRMAHSRFPFIPPCLSITTRPSYLREIRRLHRLLIIIPAIPMEFL
jgi:hypothetical protein